MWTDSARDSRPGAAGNAVEFGAVLVVSRPRVPASDVPAKLRVMDPETKQRFDTLENAMVRLAEGQVGLSEGLQQTNAAVRELAVEMRALAEAQKRTEERMGWFAEQMLRGFDRVSGRVTTLEDRVEKLDGR